MVAKPKKVTEERRQLKIKYNPFFQILSNFVCLSNLSSPESIVTKVLVKIKITSV